MMITVSVASALAAPTRCVAMGAQFGSRKGCCAKADSYLATLSGGAPSAANDWQRDWVQQLDASLRRFVGESLVEPKALFEDPDVVCVSHRGDNPVFNYATQAGLDLFEMTWDEFVRTPSRHSAPDGDDRVERERLLATVTRDNYIRDYRGLRVSKTGRRFYINNVLVWNVVDDEAKIIGQAARFRRSDVRYE